MDAALHNIGLFILIAFLCYFFKDWWPVLLIVFIARSTDNSKKDH